MRLQDKVVVVTGAAGGIGRSIAEVFAREGARVAITDRNIDEGTKTAAAIEREGGHAKAFQVDVTKGDSVAAMVAAVVAQFGRLDVLVNNAGIRYVKPFLEYTETEWRNTLDVNLTGLFLCSKAAIPEMIKAGKGKVINIASVAGDHGRPQRIAYCASKGGTLAFTKALAVDMAGKNVCVNAISPALINSPLNAGYANDESIADVWGEELLVKRWGRTEDIALAALYLASDDSDFVTGTVMTVDGGWTCGLIREGEMAA